MGSGFLLFLCIMLSMHMQCDWKLAIATVIASVNLIAVSPIDSENRRLDTDENRKVRLYNLFFCWNINDNRLTSTLYHKENV